MSDLFGNHIVGFPTRWLKLMVINGVLYDGSLATLPWSYGSRTKSQVVIADWMCNKRQDSHYRESGNNVYFLQPYN